MHGIDIISAMIAIRLNNIDIVDRCLIIRESIRVLVRDIFASHPLTFSDILWLGMHVGHMMTESCDKLD